MIESKLQQVMKAAREHWMLALALLLSAVNAAMLRFGGPRLIADGAAVVALILLAVGFLLWIVPVVREQLRSRYWKGILVLAHAGILVLAAWYAKVNVNLAMGLPPQYFDATVSVLAVEHYPFLWMFVVALLSFAVFVALMLVAVICMLSTYPLVNDLVMLIAKALRSGSKARLFLETGRRRLVLKGFSRALGAAVIALAAGTILDWHEKSLRRHPNSIRCIAYYVDYYYASRYPGVESGRKLRLLDNGVVSYAERSGWDVKISTERVREQ